jgi:CMP-N-acetylneuraminic acid synthetase
MNKVIAIIPARAGSKRLPGKNLLPLGGKPLIVHSIEYAKNNINIDEVYVSTDSNEICKVAEINGAILLDRPKELARDTTLTIDVLKHHLENELSDFKEDDLVVLLQATNPLRPENLITDALEIIKAENVGTLATFTMLNKKYGQISNDKYIPVNYKPGQRIQDIQAQYYENGLLYIAEAGTLRKGELINEQTYALVIDDISSAVDIDEEADLLFAEFLLERQSANHE